MPKLTLYHAAPSRSSIVRWMLEELGEPYDVHLLSLKNGENREPAYLAINPMGKVPALRHGDAVITEAAAICTYLADEFPHAGPTCPSATRAAAPISSGCSSAQLHRAGDHWSAPSRARSTPRPPRSGFGDFDTVDGRAGQGRGRGYALPPGRPVHRRRRAHRLTLRWGMLFKLIPERPEFAAYVGRLTERPAFRRATE